jgi:hypothetical protein
VTSFLHMLIDFVSAPIFVFRGFHVLGFKLSKYLLQVCGFFKWILHHMIITDPLTCKIATE